MHGQRVLPKIHYYLLHLYANMKCPRIMETTNTNRLQLSSCFDEKTSNKTLKL